LLRPHNRVVFAEKEDGFGTHCRALLGNGDAKAIAEAGQRPTMRFVPVKTVEQLDLQALHRAREQLVGKRTAVINQLRSFLLERGIVFRQGRRHLASQMPRSLRPGSHPCHRACRRSITSRAITAGTPAPG
jgi:transposase